MVDKKFYDVTGAVICIIVFGLVCVWSTDQLAGQSTAASITGLITDQSGAVLPGAEIQAVELGKNYAYSTVSNDLGQYSLPNLVDGSYRLTVKMVGFQTHVVQDIVLAGRDHRRIDVQLKIGELSTSVEVTGGATLITTESARISDVKDREVLDKLPLTLRRTWDYFQLTPTVSKPRNNWYIRFGGSRNKQGDMSVDGASISTIWGGPINGVVSDRTEGYQEMRIDSAGNFGRICRDRSDLGRLPFWREPAARLGLLLLHDAGSAGAKSLFAGQDRQSRTCPGRLDWRPRCDSEDIQRQRSDVLLRHTRIRKIWSSELGAVQLDGSHTRLEKGRLFQPGSRQGAQGPVCRQCSLPEQHHTG